MEAPDLRSRPPRRWNEELEGIRWLPRLIDKARAFQGGTLGTYLYGQSPIDADVLKQFGLGHSALLRIVAAAPDDAAVIAALRERDPERFETARRWTQDGLSAKWGWFVPALDIDDGYAPKWYAPGMRVAADALAGTVKLIFRKQPRRAP